MAVTKVKLFMDDGSRLEVQQTDSAGAVIPVVVVDPLTTIDVMTTDATPLRIASFPRSSVRYWSTDLAVITNA